MSLKTKLQKVILVVLVKREVILVLQNFNNYLSRGLNLTNEEQMESENFIDNDVQDITYITSLHTYNIY